MRTTVSKLILSKISSQVCHLPKASILGRCVPVIGFSTGNDAGRLTSSEKCIDDNSEDLFLRSLNFGDDGHEDQQRAHQKAPLNRPSARPTLHGVQQSRKEPPLQGDNGIDDASGDLFPDFNSGDDEFGRSGGGHRGRPPSRSARRGPPREDFGRSRQSSFKDSGRDYMDDFGSSQTRSRSRSAGGDRREELDIESPYNGRGSENLSGGQRGSDRIGDALAQKFNFGEGCHPKMEDDNKKHSASTEMPEKEGPPEDADEIFKKMKETGLIPNAVAMLDGLCKDGLVQDAMKLFGLMREKGTIPEVVIYTAVVEGFLKAAKFDDAKRIFRKMQKNGITPNAYSYKVTIQGLCKGKKLEDSVEFCFEMLDAGHSPSAATLVDLVDGFIKDKGVEEAKNVLTRLLQRGFLLDEKAVREHLNKKGPFSPTIWEIIFGKKNTQGPF